MAGRELEQGDVLRDYVLHERLGSGGAGAVFRASHRLVPERVVAVKVPHDERSADLLLAEGQTEALLEGDPGVVRVLELALDHEPPFIVTEYCPGGSLRTWLAAAGGRRTVAHALWMAEPIARTLARVHERGVVHGDLKPSNVLLGPHGEPRLADFGLARRTEELGSLLSQSLESGSGDIAGTLAYMAPEQRIGRRPDARADVWAFGLMLFEMVAGRLPEPGDRIGDFAAGVDDALEEVFARCHTRLEKRFESGAELLAALGGDAAPIEPPPIGHGAALTAGVPWTEAVVDALAAWRGELPDDEPGYDGVWAGKGPFVALSGTIVVLRCVDVLTPQWLDRFARAADELFEKRYFAGDRRGMAFVVVAREIRQRLRCVSIMRRFFDIGWKKGLLLFELASRHNFLRELHLPSDVLFLSSVHGEVSRVIKSIDVGWWAPEPRRLATPRSPVEAVEPEPAFDRDPPPDPAPAPDAEAEAEAEPGADTEPELEAEPEPEPERRVRPPLDEPDDDSSDEESESEAELPTPIAE